jgi:hypothetical protein
VNDAPTRSRAVRLAGIALLLLPALSLVAPALAPTPALAEDATDDTKVLYYYATDGTQPAEGEGDQPGYTCGGWELIGTEGGQDTYRKVCFRSGVVELPPGGSNGPGGDGGYDAGPRSQVPGTQRCGLPRADQVVIYQHATFGGNCEVLGPGDYAHSDAFGKVGNDAISSIVVGGTSQSRSTRTPPSAAHS